MILLNKADKRQALLEIFTEEDVSTYGYVNDDVLARADAIFEYAMQQDDAKGFGRMAQYTRYQAILRDLSLDEGSKRSGAGYEYSDEFEMKRYSDIKHTEYFDNFLDRGEYEKIAKGLANAGLPTSVLKSVNIGIPENGLVIETDKGNVKIIQEVDRMAGSSPVITNFEIILYPNDGSYPVQVYEFSRDGAEGEGVSRYLSENMNVEKSLEYFEETGDKIIISRDKKGRLHARKNGKFVKFDWSLLE